MNKNKLAKYVTTATVTTGMAIALPTLAPFIAPFVVPLLARVLSEETVKVLGKKSIESVFGIFGNLAASAIWESPDALRRNPENQDLLRLLANAYLKAINALEFSENGQADKVLPLVEKRIKKAIDTQKADDLLMLFPLDKNSQKGDLKYSFANRISSGEVILQMADESFSKNEILADEIEISIRRWYNEEKNAETQKATGLTIIGLSTTEPLPEPLCSQLREKLSKLIPKEVGDVIKSPEFNRSWIAFQSSHLQVILKEIKNKQNGLSDEDRALIKQLAKNTDALSMLKHVPETLTEMTADILSRSNESEANIKQFVADQANDFYHRFGVQLHQLELRLTQGFDNVESNADRRHHELLELNKRAIMPRNQQSESAWDKLFHQAEFSRKQLKLKRRPERSESRLGVYQDSSESLEIPMFHLYDPVYIEFDLDNQFNKTEDDEVIAYALILWLAGSFVRCLCPSNSPSMPDYRLKQNNICLPKNAPEIIMPVLPPVGEQTIISLITERPFDNELYESLKNNDEVDLIPVLNVLAKSVQEMGSWRCLRFDYIVKRRE